MTPDIEAMRKAAEAADRGHWRAFIAANSGRWTIDNGIREGLLIADCGQSENARSQINAEHIAASQPRAVLALIAERDALVEAMVVARDQFAFYAREHRNKASSALTDGAREAAMCKALVNEQMAQRMETTLRRQKR